MECEKCGYHFEDADVCPQCGAEVDTMKGTAENSKFIQAIEELKNGNQAAFATVYEHTYKYVYSRARMLFSDEQEIMDVVQEVYISVYRNIHTLQSNESIFAWLRTITFHAGSRIVKKKKNEVLLTEDDTAWLESLPDEGAEIENDYINKEDIEIIRDCINRLSEEHRSVILAYYYDNLKVNEISELLSISPGTVKSRLFSARNKLKGYIEEQEKKRGYKLHSFGAVALLLALRALLQQNMVVTDSQSAATYNSICSELGMTIEPTISMNVSSSSKISKSIGKSLLKRAAEIGVKKAVLSTVGAITAAAVVVGGTVAVLDSLNRTENDIWGGTSGYSSVFENESSSNEPDTLLDADVMTQLTTSTATTNTTTTTKKPTTVAPQSKTIELYKFTTYCGFGGFFTKTAKPRNDNFNVLPTEYFDEADEQKIYFIIYYLFDDEMVAYNACLDSGAGRFVLPVKTVENTIRLHEKTTYYGVPGYFYKVPANGYHDIFIDPTIVGLPADHPEFRGIVTEYYCKDDGVFIWFATDWSGDWEDTSYMVHVRDNVDGGAGRFNVAVKTEGDMQLKTIKLRQKTTYRGYTGYFYEVEDPCYPKDPNEDPTILELPANTPIMSGLATEYKDVYNHNYIYFAIANCPHHDGTQHFEDCKGRFDNNVSDTTESFQIWVVTK